jgi:hypothetical protein
LKITIATELKQCQFLWQKFSPHQHLWDDWQINECLYNADRDQFKFMYTEKSLLPIVYNRQKNRHELMGNGFAENRTLWIDENEVDDFFAQLPENTFLYDMNGSAIEKLLSQHAIYSFEHDCSRYFMAMPAEQFLAQASSNFRRNINKVMRDLANVKFKVMSDGLNTCITFNKARFGDESDFNEPAYLAAWHKIDALPYVNYLVGTLDNKIVACMIIAEYKNILYALMSGYDLAITGLGNALMWQAVLLKDSLGLKELDFMAGGDDWKSRWRLQSEKYYTYSS